MSALTACQKEKEKKVDVTVGIQADAIFTEAGEANLTVVLSDASDAAVTVSLAASSAAQSGFTAVGADLLSFDSIVSVPAGSKSASVKVSADVASLDETFQAVITLAAADGATIDAGASTVYIGVPQNVAKQVSGADAWNLVGSFDAVALARTADEPETWVAENVSLSAPFKFSASKGGSTLELGAEGAVAVDSDIVLSKDGGEITLEEGFYTVTLYPGELKAVITKGIAPHVLNWTVEYKGQQWVEGYYTYGELDVFEVSGTDTDKYYSVYYSDLNNEYMEPYGVSLQNDPEAFFREMQANIDANIAYYEEYGYTVEDYLYDYCYNELTDGTTLLYYGQPAGDYEFLVVSMDAQGQLDWGYKYITFTIEEDPESQYDWDIYANIREDWTATVGEWYEGYEGQYFWIDGYAPGAAYTIIDLYTDGEIDWYLNGELKNFIGNTNANIQSYLDSGYYTPEEVFGYLGAYVDEDGYFSDYVSTYGIEGEANLLILGFDENGQLINTSAYSNGADMGKAVIEVPVYVQEPLDLTLNENWGAEFLGTFTDHQTNTYYDYEKGEDVEVEEDVDLSVIKITGLAEGEYVGAGLYGAGYIDEESLADYVRYAGEGVIETYNYYVWYYDNPDLTLADVANTAEYPWLFYSGLTEDSYGDWDLLIAGVSEDFEVTGEYALATITFDGTRLDSDPTVTVKKVKRGKVDLKARSKVRSHVARTAPADRAPKKAFTKPAAGKKAAAGKQPMALKSASGRLSR